MFSVAANIMVPRKPSRRYSPSRLSGSMVHPARMIFPCFIKSMMSFCEPFSRLFTQYCTIVYCAVGWVSSTHFKLMVHKKSQDFTMSHSSKVLQSISASNSISFLFVLGSILPTLWVGISPWRGNSVCGGLTGNGPPETRLDYLSFSKTYQLNGTVVDPL